MNRFGGEKDIATTRVVASYRAIQALYQAYRIQSLLGAGPRGLYWKSAGAKDAPPYYAMKFCVERYTIVDIPLNGTAQANFLGRVLDADSPNLEGEGFAERLVQIWPPHTFFSDGIEQGLIVNIDSLTEMSLLGRSLLEAFGNLTPRFLSINHEANTFVFSDIYRDTYPVHVSRMP